MTLDGLPLSVQLREIVKGVARTSTLTCAFVPGGRLHGAGIPGPSYCATCNQSFIWHAVAKAIPIVERHEAAQPAGDHAGEEHIHVTSDR